MTDSSANRRARPRRYYGSDEVSTLTGYQYRRHNGCRHPVRVHAYRSALRGCLDTECGCHETRLSLTGRPDVLRAVDVGLRVAGTWWLFDHTYAFLAWFF